MTVAPVDTAIAFRVNGRSVEVSVPGGSRLLDVLRSGLGLTGTKEGCGEGECGACSVLLDGEVVASCLVPVAQVEGAEITTVEGLGLGDELDPLQRAFRDRGGVQCGICTPGMLVAARAWLARGEAPTDAAIREAISGNLCRCTGYTKIVEAITAAATDDGRAWDPDRPPGSAPAGADGAALPVPSPVVAPYRAPRTIAPQTLDEALGRLAETPRPRPLAGGTDVMVELVSGAAPSERPLLDLWHLDALRGIRVEDGELVLGALTTYSELRRSPDVAAVPVLAEMAAAVGAAQIQARGTIGGNVMTASPAGDALPVLLATDATLEVASAGGRRRIPATDFWPAYRRTALSPDELLIAVRIPIVPGRRVRFRKLGTRRAQAISKVVMAVAWCEAHGRDGGAAWSHVRVALGSVAPTPIRARRTEAVLEGTAPSGPIADLAAEIVRSEISPIDDVRSTAAYRRDVAGRMLRRVILDAIGPG